MHTTPHCTLRLSPLPQLHVLLSNVGHQCGGPLPPGVSDDTQSQAEPWNEDDENLSDTDSESEWNTGPGPVTQV